MNPVKLNWAKVDRIRDLHNPSKGIGYKTLARMFNVSSATIKSIIRGETWPVEKRRFFENG